jgi:hypothetical protein
MVERERRPPPVAFVAPRRRGARRHDATPSPPQQPLPPPPRALLSPPRRTPRISSLLPRALGALLLAAAALLALPLPRAEAKRLAADSLVVVSVGDSTVSASSSRTVAVTFLELDVTNVPSGGAASLRQTLPLVATSSGGVAGAAVSIAGAGSDSSRFQGQLSRTADGNGVTFAG